MIATLAATGFIGWLTFRRLEAQLVASAHDGPVIAGISTTSSSTAAGLSAWAWRHEGDEPARAGSGSGPAQAPLLTSTSSTPCCWWTAAAGARGHPEDAARYAVDFVAAARCPGCPPRGPWWRRGPRLPFRPAGVVDGPRDRGCRATGRLRGGHDPHVGAALRGVGEPPRQLQPRHDRPHRRVGRSSFRERPADEHLASHGDRPAPRDRRAPRRGRTRGAPRGAGRAQADRLLRSWLAVVPGLAALALRVRLGHRPQRPPAARHLDGCRRAHRRR